MGRHALLPPHLMRQWRRYRYRSCGPQPGDPDYRRGKYPRLSQPRQYAKRWLMYELRHGPRRTTELVDEWLSFGFRYKAFASAREELRAEGKIGAVQRMDRQEGVRYWMMRRTDVPYTPPADARHKGDGNFQEIKMYACPRYPELRLGHIQFQYGWYRTHDPDEQTMIEHADGYGVHIRQVCLHAYIPPVGEDAENRVDELEAD